MTVETITEQAYQNRIADLAGQLADIAQDEEPDNPYLQDDVLVEAVDDLLYGEDWFARTYYGAAAHGCIVEHRMHDAYIDPGVVEADSPTESIKRMAYETVRLDTIEEARTLLD